MSAAFAFVFDEEEVASGVEIGRALGPATKRAFLQHCLQHQYQLSSSTKQRILVALLQQQQPTSAADTDDSEEEEVALLCRAFEADESEPWLGVLAGMVLSRASELFESTLRSIQLSLPPSTTSAAAFTLPKHVVPPHWAYLQPDLLPDGFDAPDTMRNEHFETSVALPDRIAPVMDATNRKDADLIRLFFMKGINLEKITEIFLEQGDTVLIEGKPVAMNTYLKLDPNPEKKVWNIVKRGEKPKPAKRTKTDASSTAGADTVAVPASTTPEE